MIDVKNISNFYFLGIGGIGMSALARFFRKEGKYVAGYDKTSSPLTRKLEEEGLDIHYQDDVNNIPSKIIEDKNSLIVFTPAIPEENQEMAYFKQSPFVMVKRARVLGYLSREYKTLAVAGTHGKTTISTMLAHLMQYGDDKAHAFLGGIAANYDTNYIHAGNSPFMVVEADEFDRSFHQLKPAASIISVIDADHLDIYRNKEGLEHAFDVFAALNSDFILKRYDTGINAGPENIFTYALNDERADYYASDMTKSGLCYSFSLNAGHEKIENIKMAVPGLLNVENMVAAMAMALMQGVTPLQLQKAVAEFRGIKRRFEIVLQNKNSVYIDDYAHHPEEIKRTLESIRALFPGKKITGIFQPHLYSRTRDLADEFAKSLDKLDQCILLPVYPAREEAIPGVNSEMIANKMSVRQVKLMEKDELIPYLRKEKPEILLSLGAGDIDRLVNDIKNSLDE